MQYLNQSIGRELPHPATVSVLIVEDVRAERMRLAAVIRRLGYNTVEARDGAEADALIAEGRIEIVLSDWQMPAVGGVDLCKRVVSRDRNPPYFILMTGRDQPEDLVTGLDAGADDFMHKPATAAELRVRLQAGLRVLQMRRELGQRACEARVAKRRIRQLELELEWTNAQTSASTPFTGRAHA